MGSATAPQTVDVPDLPVHLTRFIGRERELADLAPLIATTRLLTLTGAGGSGKTRLAGEVASRAGTTFQRVAWVDFAALADPSLVAQQVMNALHLPERIDTAASDLLVADIGSSAMLLVLDNCEHLVDACAALADTLLRGCPRLTILATSREALGVPSETSWLVPPMQPLEATQLFVERAQGAVATFRLTDANAETLREICRRLDGMPLAIELAAARVRALSPEQIAERLNDAFRLLTAGSRTALPRHRTLRGVIDWSYSLLTEREQVLLARLGVFSGSFSLEAVESVCAGAPLLDEDILDGVAALVDKSLVVMDAGEGVARYHLLETVRQYGVERLGSANEEMTLRERHAQFFVALAERTHPRLVGGEHDVGLTNRLKADNDNIRAACTWALADDARTDYALRLSAALFWYWYCTGQFHEARKFIDAALPHAEYEGSAPRLQGGALASKGLLALAQGRLDEARDALTLAHALQQQGGDDEGAAVSLIKLGATYLLRGEIETSARLLGDAAKTAGRFSPMVQVFVNFWRGWSTLEAGDFMGARGLFSQSWNIGKVSEHGTILAHSATMLGYVSVAEGKPDEAFVTLLESLRQHTELGDVWGLALDIDGMAAVAAARGEMFRAVTLLAGADALRDRMGMARPAIALAKHERLVQAVRDALGADFERLYAEGLSRPLHDLIRKAQGEDVTGTYGVATSLARTPETATNGAAPSAGEVAASRLAVDALGPLQVYVDGTAIDPASWGSARSRELLVYLLTHPDGVTKEQVGLAFWPDASTSQLRNNFHVTLHRLRKTLGVPAWITLTQERYAVDPAALERFDVAVFEHEIKAARRALKRQEEGAVSFLERAVALYRGDFMDGEPAGDWHLEMRDEVQRIYIEALMELGAAQTKEQRYAKAAEAYRRVLARDELHEEALRALMLCQARQGERTPAMRLYQRFAERLRRELDAAPDRSTTALFERLQAAETV